MDETNTPERNKRQKARIRGVYLVRFCPENSNSEWDITQIKNIGTGGIMFQSAKYFARGSKINIEICHLSGTAGKICTVSVLRCNKMKGKENIYDIVIDIAQLDEETKNALHKTIETFLKKRY